MSEDERSGARTARDGRGRVLALSTIAFTLMFAVWLMFGVLGVPIREELGLTDVQLSWLVAVTILNGAIWRLPAGVAADRFGGRRVLAAMLLATAVPCALVSWAESYEALLLYGFLLGFAGNAFSVGVAWNAAWFPRERQGLALGVFGAGNVGASVTKLIGPWLIAAVPAGVWLIPGGWRLIPVLYAVALVAMAIALLALTPRRDRHPGRGRSLREALRPIRSMRVLRFSLYYVVVFGAYVALSAWLPKYYVDVFGLPLAQAALLTALFIFPASLLRPLGGYLSDRFGPRRTMYATLGVIALVSFVLAMPDGHIVLYLAGDRTRDVLHYRMTVVPFTVLVFLLGVAQGIGKAAVYKYIPEYFPRDVGAVGGLVGMLGALGGFVLPPLFAYTETRTGMPQTTWLVLFVLAAASLLWLHRTVMSMLRSATPELRGRFERAGPTPAM